MPSIIEAPTTIRLAVLIAGSILLHLALGWEWTLAAGVAAGLWFARGGWIFGGVVVGADWLVLLIYNFIVDARAVGVMTETVGSILGNMPSFGVVAITLLIGLLLGVLGGAVGTQLRRLLASRSKPVERERRRSSEI